MERATSMWSRADHDAGFGIPVLIGWHARARAPADLLPVVVDASDGILVVGSGPAARGVFRAVVIDLAERCAGAGAGAHGGAGAGAGEVAGAGAAADVELRSVGDDRIADLRLATEPPAGIGAVPEGQAVAVFLAPDPLAVVLLIADDGADTHQSVGTRSSHGTRIVVAADSCTVESGDAVSRALRPRFPARV